MKKIRKTGAAWLLALILLFAACTALGEESVPAEETARELTAACAIDTSFGANGVQRMTDADYTTYWQGKKTKDPWVSVSSGTPIFGLYLCFRKMPESYVIEEAVEAENPETGAMEMTWIRCREGDTRFHHVYYALDGQTEIRVRATQGDACEMGFNEIFVFGEGEPPSWVQRWEEIPEKTDILFLVAHPDDELLFMGGAIATYASELKKTVAVAYLTFSNTTRRSEALNGLWHMGVRYYPDFGGFRDVYSGKLKEAYEKVTGKKKAVHTWVTGLYRRIRPDVVVTQDLKKGEYGHGQHMMIADSAIACVEAAADPSHYPDSAKQYGTWQVKKLYVHLWGDESNQTHFDWEVPLQSMGGKTGTELAEEAYALHVSQQGMGKKYHGRFIPFSVRKYGGELYPNTVFGLCFSEVGPDVNHDDFLENID